MIVMHHADNMPGGGRRGRGRGLEREGESEKEEEKEEERGQRGGGVREVEMEGDRRVRRETALTAQLSAFCQEEVRDRNVPNLHSHLSSLSPSSLVPLLPLP